MPELDVIENIFATERYRIVIPDSDECATEVAAMFKSTLADPNGHIADFKNHTVEKHIVHRTMQDVKLQVVIGVPVDIRKLKLDAKSSGVYFTSHYWQMGVLDERGMMTFAVEKQRGRRFNFQDPYIQMIAGYFRSHLEAGN